MTEFDDAAGRVAGGADHMVEAAALVAQMTLEEKLGSLDGDVGFWPGVQAMMSVGYGSQTWPAAHVDRLGIPGLDFVDGPRGCVMGEATAFPVSMARGASFDPDLERQVGEAIGAELRANGATFTGAVCMNLLRHAAWGRAQETYGEDPHHVGEMAAAFTNGLQKFVMASMKHFALNSMENARFKVNVTADERTLHEVYLPHFKRVADAGVASVMSAYNSLNGEWCGENHTLLTTILRDEWGWDGVVITDFLLGLRDPAKSVAAGMNIEMPFAQQRAVTLDDALATGTVSLDDIDARVTESVATFLRFARVYDAGPDGSVMASAEHRTLARSAAAQSAVLMRNTGLLPVNPTDVGSIAVLGTLATAVNMGDAGSSNVLHTPNPVTALAGITAGFPNATVTHHADVADDVEDADLVVVVVGYTKDDEGEYLGSAMGDLMATVMPPMDHPRTGFTEPPPPADEQAEASPGGDGVTEGGDRDSLRLNPADEALIAAAAAANPNVVVAVVAGSAVVVPWLESVPAALMVWYAGLEGGAALADVLTGTEPGGRLPFAVPTDEAHLVPFDKEATEFTYDLLHGQWYLDANGTPAHLPFGFGLSYSSFALSDASVADKTATATVTNTGSRSGSTVLQVYGSVPTSAHQRPPQRLVGFTKVFLDAGESTQVAIALDTALLDLRLDGAWVTEDQPVQFNIGFDAASTQPIGGS